MNARFRHRVDSTQQLNYPCGTKVKLKTVLKSCMIIIITGRVIFQAPFNRPEPL